ncbi:MAG TPA: glycosyltransferase family 4 protein [Polaromonas sp.]|uniref:glycosyltransferase family 4 protein n=1 Tax=Polaromonas sp. TaxID=1869339 RepID=UPI002D6DA0AE|nr:glycosyltransferase family 4 protein [Polaromonas sp.]HYW58701.1 glycosyltransferase family 4 protein [Polaromonas sp.]
MNSPSPRLRIAVLNRVFETTGGGAERYSIALVEHLSQRHEVHVFAQQIKHDFPGVSYHKVSMPMRKPRWINQLWYAWSTWRATRSGFDIVHSHENTWHGQVQTVHVLPVKHNLFHGRTGITRVLRWVKVLTSPRLLAYLWLERVRFKSQPERRVVVTSPSLQGTMAATYPASAAATSVITPGVHLPDMVTDLDKSTARQQLGLPEAGPCLLFVGNDYKKKGLDTLLQAMTSLPDDVVLAVVGSASHIAAYKTQAEAAGLGKRVFFLGALPDVMSAYRAANMLVHPTLEDTFAMVVLEAMAHGLPVVVSSAAYCGISGLLSPGQNAFILENPQDAQQMGLVLNQLSGDAALRQQLGQQARTFASQYRWADIAQQQEAVYLSLLKRPA